MKNTIKDIAAALAGSEGERRIEVDKEEEEEEEEEVGNGSFMNLPTPPQSTSEASRRSKECVTLLKMHMNDATYAKFRSISEDYASGSLHSEQYFNQSIKLLQSNDCVYLFPELVSLLPDAEKRAHLFGMYTRSFSNKLPQPPKNKPQKQTVKRIRANR